ncbi:MAG: 30S ribosomal protein S18 [Candidatus Doudnabacteria bacterium CG10_big_fil_rev_8_21_14_0_10_42_18]|uniref:Small ribosomal subunit protein bS18 n=1 Tax=Candidatus Doudnabacteria bacterium CG10_big_fil_rev_8_21_14_0_10_42_18 TaxID=1974552 RepID=A0A2H0VBG9_9BACT|nr:MAG: 30S ribosomal protein S18 [Candidatus Doudnabacteria bacterium CG10_big_fil_rev_8_21_14_0_10_42_18]
MANNNNNNNRNNNLNIKKVCFFCANKMTTVDYKDTQALRRFMSPHAKILNHKRTGTCPKHQRVITQALKRARHMALLPFVAA